MATNYAVASNQRKTINQQLDEYFGKGNQVEQLGNSMRKDALPYVINPQKQFDGENLPPSFKRK